MDWLSSRYYNGAQGRFTSADKLVGKPNWIAEPQRWNRYAYALNNPLKFIDRDGHDAIAAFFLGEDYRDVSTLEVIFSKETIDDVRRGAAQFFGEHRAITHGFSPVPTSKSELALQAVPFVGKVAGPVLKKTGNAAAQKLAGIAADDGPIVIGETMKRVEAAAAKIPGAKIIKMPEFKEMGLSADEVTSAMMAYNRKWLLEMIKDGRKIIDIGLDPKRKKDPSIFYEMEQSMLRNYRKLHPEFDNVVRH